MTNEISISKYVNDEGVKKWIADSLQERSQQFVTSLISLVNNDAKLMDVDKKSLITACMTAASLNLPVNPSLGFAYVIPYNDNKSGKKLAQLQLGYKAFIQLSMRSGQFRLLNVSDVKEGEIKKIDRLSGEIRFKWLEADRDKAKTIGFVGFFRLKNGFKKSMYMTAEELKAHGLKYSQNYKKYGNGLWRDEFDAMAKKTVIKLLLSKYAPMTSDMETAQIRDQAVAIDEDEYLYLDNKKETAQEISEEKEEQRLLTFIKEAKSIDELEQCKSSCTTNPTTEAYQEKEKELANLNIVKATPVGVGAKGVDSVTGPVTGAAEGAGGRDE